MSDSYFGSDKVKQSLDIVVDSPLVKNISMACVDNHPAPTHLKEHIASLSLPLLPVRYSVIPNTLTANIPADTGAGLAEMPDLQHHRYGLRALRQGYVYLYYEQHPRDSALKWEIFSVAENGHLCLINHKNLIRDKDGKAEAGINTHSAIPYTGPCPQAIYIEQPAEQGPLWLAFSEFLWSRETLQRMENNAQARQRRMQAFDPKSWIANHRGDYSALASADNLHNVIDYNTTAGSELARQHKGEISSANGDYNKDYLEQRSSLYSHGLSLTDFIESKAVGPQSLQLEQALKKTPYSQKLAPLLFSLKDSAGIALELNGYRNEPAGYVEQYQKERELQIHSMNTIDGAKTMMKNHAVNTLSRKTPGHKMTPEAFEHVGGIDGNPAYKDALVIPYVDKNGVDKLHIIEKRFQTSWKKRLAKAKKNYWDDYRDEIDHQSFDFFKERYQQLLKQAQQLVDQRTDDLLAWITSQAFIDDLSEFDTSNLADGNHCTDLIGEVLLGICSSPAGKALLESWVQATTISDDNLLWRAMAINNDEGKAATEELLKLMAEAKGKALGKNNLAHWADQAEYAMKKLFTLSSGSLALYEHTQSNLGFRAASNGLEKIFTTVNQLFFKNFLNRGMDTISAFLMEGVLMVRSGVQFKQLRAQALEELLEYEQSLLEKKQKILDKFDNPHWQQSRSNKTKNQARNAFIKTDDRIKKLQINSRFRQETMQRTLNYLIRSMEEDHETVRKNFERELKRADAGGANNIARIRFSAALTLLQGYAVANLIHTLKTNQDDAQTKTIILQLTTSGLYFSSALFGIAGTFATLATPSSSAGYLAAKLKFAGGAFMVVAGAISMGVDGGNSYKHFTSGESFMGTVYLVKAALNFGIAGSGSISAIGALNPILKHSSRALLQRVGAKAAAWMVARVFLMSSLGLGLALLAVEILIMVLKDDELENWLEKSAFGEAKRKGKLEHRRYTAVEEQQHRRYTTVEEQQKAFEKAISAVLQS